MEISTSIDREKNLRLHVVTGRIDVPEMIRMLAELYQTPDYKPDMKVLWDMGQADFSDVTTEHIQSLMEMVKNNWGKEQGGKAALVATKDLDFGLTRMYELALGAETSRNIVVFKNLADAEKWLAE